MSSSSSSSGSSTYYKEKSQIWDTFLLTLRSA